MDLTLNPDKPPAKSIPCSAHVEIKKLNPNYSTKSRLCLKLDPKEHFWRLANQDKHELDFTDVDCVSVDLQVISTANGVINMPLVSLCKVDEVKPGEEKGSTEVVTAFDSGEIENLACGKIIQVDDAAPIVTQV